MPGSSFKVKALYEYASEEPDDLSFRDGQIITVTDEEDADWYTGEYVDESGERREGIFPRNFVEKFEPTIPTRPARAPKRAPVHVEHTPEPPPAQAPPPAEPLQTHSLQEATPSNEAPISDTPPKEEPVAPAPAPAPKPAAPSPAVVSTSRSPPPVADKPSSSSFKDRIAAFNKPAAAPITPFKPGGSTSTGFIKKPFVAPPPSRNAYIPPAREQPVQKPYRREEEPSSLEAETKEAAEPHTSSHPEPPEEDQPKPQSLKDRIALLQKQQMEQAARNAEKKEKPKKPAKKRVEPTESLEDAAPAEPAVQQISAEDTFRRPSTDFVEDESDVAPLSRRATGIAGVTPQPQPVRELVSDTNDADDSGAGDDEDAQETSTEEERPKSKGVDSRTSEVNKQKAAPAEQDKEGDEGEDDEEDEEEEEDPELRRRRELRERMAKMSGGMGMMGMFGPPGGMSASGARKSKPAETRQPADPQPQEAPEERPAPVRIMALPGMSSVVSKRQEEPAEDSDDQTAQATPQEPHVHEESEDYVSRPIERRSTDRPAPPIPQAPPAAPPRETRAVPPPPPASSRPHPPNPQSPTSRPPPPLPPTAPSAVEAPVKDEELEAELSGEEDVSGQPSAADGSPGPSSVQSPPPMGVPEPPRVNTNDSTASPATDKRASRLPPPVPMSPTVASPQTRAPPPPPPPPPGLPPSRRSTSDSRGFGVSQGAGGDASDEDEVTEYDGDYDTDIASGAKHKDALKSHNRDSSLDDDMLTDDATKSLKSPTARTVPPIPPVPAPAPRDVPPPPPAPSQPAPKSRSSMDAPRAAPPPVPPPKVADDEEYDPYRYSGSQHGLPLHPNKTQYSTKLQSPKEELEEEDMYGASPPPVHIPPPPAERSAPPPPPPERSEYAQAPTGFAPPPPAVSPRPSLDVKRSGTVSRRSMEQSRPSGEQSYIAHDIDLGRGSMWWVQENMFPPSLQGRQDVLLEMETSSSTKRGGRTSITRDIYVLYMDYSQTTINVSFDAADPSHVTLEQNHQRPPPPPRRDQLESASAQYGSQIAKAATSVLGLSLADGSAQGLILELLKPHTTALRPVGTRAYGALVYANLGNASTQQYDEIRPGDIVTFRNAKFAGHTGTMHTKYSIDVGKPEHVAIVAEWDGTKKKIRALEQGRDLEKGKKPKLREHSFKVGDLKSGEVMVWRIMPRTWVGWDSGK
ncbi:hypothetical protein PV08_00429 [Exophiala spinifera]|uniref:SH3 domain-containing protein n=1 Tax=Exophiala spinifera TaxID=91928 RepID=A0A0D2C8H4_9EURO|nr:uncharacterized protein PV08_00429 [Exophiala spinifera]KIW19854.1 hypothetical protein PV08_00429 [Exophiala spinifera]